MNRQGSSRSLPAPLTKSRIRRSCLDLHQGHAKSDDVADVHEMALKIGSEGRAERALAMPQADAVVDPVEVDGVGGAIGAASILATNTAWFQSIGGT